MICLTQEPIDYQALTEQVRQPHGQRLLDRLIVSALIEARSEERLRLLSKHLPDAELRAFYGRLADSEAGHGSLFVRLARKHAGCEERLLELSRIDAGMGRIRAVRVDLGALVQEQVRAFESYAASLGLQIEEAKYTEKVGGVL